MSRFLRPLQLTVCLAALNLAIPAPAQPAAATVQPAPLAELVKAVDIPFETFTLPNGLRVIVHTDRKAPIVGVTTYYRVGSKNEPRGRTGFAHLYEHLFFGGSENVPSFDVPLEAAGSVPTNGSTWYDRTNYVETVPKGALELALFEESDRMGHLMGALSQDKLDKQRGVVENEKRQDDNEPYGLAGYAIGEGLFPVGHPYRHTAIGSMADIDAATLPDVRQWYRDHYAPNNAILVLTGDIDVAAARPLVEKYYGDIGAGPRVQPVSAALVTLAAPAKRQMTDQVSTTRLYRAWSGPGINDRDAVALDVGMRVLGGLASSRLDNALVRGSQLAVGVTAEDEQHEEVSFLTATMDIKPGVDRAAAEARFDGLIRDFVRTGPTVDELRRAATQAVSGEISALEQVGGMGGKGATLAEGLLYSGDPAHYKKELEETARLTPADVRAALQRWLSRPAFALAVVPGQRTENGAKMGGWGDEATTPARPADPHLPVPPIPPGPKRTPPVVADVAALTFPKVERARLSNGIPVALARRTAVPTVLVSLEFDAGYAADTPSTAGTQSLMMGMLDEGTATRDATAIREEEERLGATITAGAGLDASSVTMSALTPNLAPSLALMTELVRHPAFAPSEVARVKAQRLAELAEVENAPQQLAMRTLPPLLFGPGHPYGMPGDGLGTIGSVTALTPAALRTAHDTWLRPDLARITVVGDITMDRLLPLLEQAYGQWAPPPGPRPVKRLDAPVPAPRSRIVVLDRPGAPQSVIVAGRVLPLTGRDQGHESLDLANEVLGNGFLSRLNMDLREEKGWTYGVSSGVRQPLGPRTFLVLSPVQTDKTGDALKELLADMRAFPTAKPVTPEEVARVTLGDVRRLPNRFETNAEVLQAIIQNQRLGRPDDYYATLPALYRAIGAQALDAAARQYLQPDGLTVVVVGDRKQIAPQLAGLALPVEYRAAPAPPVDGAAARPETPPPTQEGPRS
ncbi:MAG: insulinase family protein [Novosphingobium sp.]|nr:insulinase family protein [Novosphingobium sp.]